MREKRKQTIGIPDQPGYIMAGCCYTRVWNYKSRRITSIPTYRFIPDTKAMTASSAVKKINGACVFLYNVHIRTYWKRVKESGSRDQR